MENNKILIIDDDHINGRFLEKKLNNCGFECIVKESGSKIFKHIEEYQPAIILLDKMMPEISGDEVLKQIREKFSRVELPVIMQTSKNEQKEVVGSLELGANDYLMKPINLSIAVARINTQLEMKRLQLENVLAREALAVKSMVITYNHEINNPLSIAIAGTKIIAKANPEIDFSRELKALERIKIIVLKIKEASEMPLEYEDYVGNETKIKVD